MDWTPGGTSSDIEDRRNESGGGGGFGGFGGGGGGFGGIHLGIGGMIIVGILSLVFRTNFFAFLGGGAPATVPDRPVAAEQHNTAQDQRDEPKLEFVSYVLDDVQRTWERELPGLANTPYHHAKLVLFRGQYPSACGSARTATGPFYCPSDEKVYLDLAFLDELKQRFGAPGQFAQAYVVAHELGHHVQKILGIEQKVHRLQQSEPGEANELSVRLELEADCYAGFWAGNTEARGKIHDEDVNSALGAAAAVGDDRLQKAAQGYANPESFTHGSSAQRQRWFRAGLQGHQLSTCNTFSAQ